jgi:hypothetical protein
LFDFGACIGVIESLSGIFKQATSNLVDGWNNLEAILSDTFRGKRKSKK